MNIREHIEAGHYQTDDKGRALVPMRCGQVATIYATDHPSEEPIIGRLPSQDCDPMWWAADGSPSCDSHPDWALLPPPPRRVPLVGWAIVLLDGTYSVRDTPPAGVATGIEKLVKLTGEYEEPWS
jgi:hypothetical protein